MMARQKRDGRRIDCGGLAQGSEKHPNYFAGMTGGANTLYGNFGSWPGGT